MRIGSKAFAGPSLMNGVRTHGITYAGRAQADGGVGEVVGAGWDDRMRPLAGTPSAHADERVWGERACARAVEAVTGLRMRGWWEAFELVRCRIVEADDRVALTERITKPGSPAWAGRCTTTDGSDL